MGLVCLVFQDIGSREQHNATDRPVKDRKHPLYRSSGERYCSHPDLYHARASKAGDALFVFFLAFYGFIL
jgi:hypothetical protein